MFEKKTIIIDIDDTVLDLGDRRLFFFKKHFPKAKIPENQIRKDVKLDFLGDKSSITSQSFLEDFSDPEVVSKVHLSSIPGSQEAIQSLINQGFEIVFLTARHRPLEEDTLESLKRIGFEPDIYTLYMFDEYNPLDPDSTISEQEYKKGVIQKISSISNVVAAIGDRISDMHAAIDAKVPAIMLNSTCCDIEEWNSLNTLNHVGLYRYDSWSEILLSIGRLQVGSSQMEELRQNFSNQYSSWLQNLNSLAAIDVTIASIIAAFSSQAVLNETLHSFSRVAVLPSLILALLSIIFAIRAFTSRYTSGPDVNNSIIPKLKQTLYILFDTGVNQHKKGDAIDEYIQLKKETEFTQSRAHLDFFYKRYGTYNPNALANLRLYEMRAVNYAKAYPEHISSSLLVWNIIYVVVWVILVALNDPSVRIDILSDSIQTTK